MKLHNGIKSLITFGLVAMVSLSGSSVLAKDYDKHLAKEAIESCINDRLLKLQDDGLFRPTDFVTATEMYEVFAVITGNEMADTQFNGNVTREEVAYIISKAYNIEDRESLKFRDADMVSKWARCSVSGLINGGYMTGRGNIFAPKDYITRGDLANILYKINKCYLMD